MNITNFYRKAKSAFSTNHATKAGANKRALSVMVSVAMGVAFLMPEMAMAAPWDSTGSAILAIFTGGLARTIAIIAVIACGIAALAGKLSWDWAIKIILGIVLIFGASAIVDYVISAAS